MREISGINLAEKRYGYCKHAQKAAPKIKKQARKSGKIDGKSSCKSNNSSK